MDISTVNKSLQLSPQSGYARIDTTEENSLPTGDLIFIDIRSDSSYRWNIGQTYTLTVATTLKDINGNSLQSPYVLSFTPEPYFRVTYTYPNNAATNVSRNYEIELEFNNTINYSTFLSSISISPPVSGSWNYYGENYVYINLSNQFELSPNTAYVVTLGTGMRDAQGRSLTSPFTFSFTTGSQ